MPLLVIVHTHIKNGRRRPSVYARKVYLSQKFKVICTLKVRGET